MNHLLERADPILHAKPSSLSVYMAEGLQESSLCVSGSWLWPSTLSGQSRLTWQVSYQSLQKEGGAESQKPWRTSWSKRRIRSWLEHVKSQLF